MVRRRKRKDKETVSKKYPWLAMFEKKALGNGGYFDSEGLLHNSEGCIRCTSMVKTTGKRCKNFTQVGDTLCTIHGGSRVSGGRIYSKFLQDDTIKSVYDNVLNEDDQTVAGIREELSLLRGLLAKVVKTEKDFDIKTIKGVAGIIGEIRQLVNDCNKAEIRLGQLIDIGKVTIIVKSLADVIQRYVKDPEIVKKIAEGFDNIPWPASLSSNTRTVQTKQVRRIPARTGEVC